MAFIKATKESAKLRLAMSGPPGSGKTMSALQIGQHFGKIALIDTEGNSASKYAKTEKKREYEVDFDAQSIKAPFDPKRIETFVLEAMEGKYDVLIIDSLTPFWNDKGGCLDLADQEATKGGRNDSFGSWKKVTPIYQRMVDCILRAPVHMIVTCRSKTEHVLEVKDGKNKVRKMGLSPEMRDNFAYFLDIECKLDEEHNLIVGKTRCPDIADKVFNKPGQEFAEIIKEWLK